MMFHRSQWKSSHFWPPPHSELTGPDLRTSLRPQDKEASRPLWNFCSHWSGLSRPADSFLRIITGEVLFFWGSWLNEERYPFHTQDVTFPWKCMHSIYLTDNIKACIIGARELSPTWSFTLMTSSCCTCQVFPQVCKHLSAFLKTQNWQMVGFRFQSWEADN